MPPVFVSEDDFLLQNYTYELPQEQIAQYPPEQRGTSRLLTMRRNGALDLEHHMFSDLPDCLPEGSLLVANNSRVLQARLLGSRSTGGKVEFLLLTPLPLVRAAATPVKGREDTWSAEVNGLVRSGGSVREGETLHFGAGISVTILECGTFGHRRVRMCWKGDVADAFAATGHIPCRPTSSVPTPKKISAVTRPSTPARRRPVPWPRPRRACTLPTSCARPCAGAASSGPK